MYLVDKECKKTENQSFNFNMHSTENVQFSSVAQSCSTLCDPMNCSMPGLPVYHQLPEFTQTHVHRVGDIIQPSHPLSPLLFLPPIPPSIRVFSNESTLCNPIDCSTPGSCPSPSPGACSNSCALNQRCRLTISSSVVSSSSPLQSLPASVFSDESALCIRWPKYCSYSFSISLSNENSGLISFRTESTIFQFKKECVNHIWIPDQKTNNANIREM